MVCFFYLLVVFRTTKTDYWTAISYYATYMCKLVVIGSLYGVLHCNFYLLLLQEMAGNWTANQSSKARVKDLQRANVCYGDVTRPSPDYKETKSSVCPIQSPLTRPATGKSHQGGAAKPSQQAFGRNLSSQYCRQFSSPEAFPSYNSPASRVTIHYSNVTGLQDGNNNFMHIEVMHPSDRKRHPTAPSRVDVPLHPGSRKGKTGGGGP